MSADPHWIYVLLAYGATFAILGAVVFKIVREHARLLAELARFKDDGVGR